MITPDPFGRPTKNKIERNFRICGGISRSGSKQGSGGAREPPFNSQAISLGMHGKPDEFGGPTNLLRRHPEYLRDQEVAGGSHFRLAQNAPCVDHTRQKTPMGQRKRNKLARPFGAVLTELVFISKITAGSSIKNFGQFSAIFAEIYPPPTPALGKPNF